jgi:hypothetical protein
MVGVLGELRHAANVAPTITTCLATNVFVYCTHLHALSLPDVAGGFRESLFPVKFGNDHAAATVSALRCTVCIEPNPVRSIYFAAKSQIVSGLEDRGDATMAPETAICRGFNH